MKIGSLFTGYGGLDIAAESVFGATTAWVADNASGPSKILAHRMPGVPNRGDITRIDWSQVEPVDIITGGSPCQDLSTAGRRAGMTDGTRSNLWVQMREAIAHVRPRFVVWENVRGALSAEASSDLEPCAGCLGDSGDGGPVLRALGRVLGDLADIGYDTVWHGLRAADVGACHGRFRVFVLAWRRDLAYPDEPGLEGQSDPQGATPTRRHGHPEQGAGGSDLTLLPTPRATDGTKGGPNQRGSSGDLMLPSAVNLLRTPTSSDTNGAGAHGTGGADLRTTVALLPTPRQQRWGDYAPAIARWEHVIGRPAPEPTEPGAKGNPRLSPRFVEWMMGLPDGWVTDVPGITRTEALTALGNGVVPQQVMAALTRCLAIRAKHAGVAA